jgi:lipopolysaccharide/colanic/teichoic acid biosynthesis glycosyltransferase
MSFSNRVKILVVEDDVFMQTILKGFLEREYEVILSDDGVDAMDHLQKGLLPDLIITDLNTHKMGGLELLACVKATEAFNAIPVMILSGEESSEMRIRCLDAGADDYIVKPFNPREVEARLRVILRRINRKSDHVLKDKMVKPHQLAYKTPFAKRMFDIFFSGLALLFLSPFFLIIYILIRLESKGPAFYYSLRVGTGYTIFKFYKFRSMYVDADKRLKDLKHLNQYNAETEENEAPANATVLCGECKAAGVQCRFPIYADNVHWCEKEYMGSKKARSGSAFFKLKDDPRITRIGKFIRNTSIDELPQLWNVFIGDMSIVGNRPLPLYEAEKLTTDKYALRFVAPAGITGLWQVEKRGKGEMSEEERLLLDNVYAEHHSFKNDIKLILKTIPALFQKESV